MDDDVGEACIIDHGSLFIKTGFAGEDAPKSVFPAVVGRYRSMGVMVGIRQRDCYCGHEALQRGDALTVRVPIERGIITNWYDMV